MSNYFANLKFGKIVHHMEIALIPATYKFLQTRRDYVISHVTMAKSAF